MISMTKLTSEKFNVLLIVLIFVIPLIALNLSFLFINNIEFDWAEKEQENEAIHEAETLAVEGHFGTEFAIHFSDFFDKIKNNAKRDNKNNFSFIDYLKQSSKQIFKEPFPSFNLYVFKIPNGTTQAELLFSEGYLSTGKKTLCKAFEYLYNENNGINNKTNETFAKILLGKYTNINAIARELKGITTNTKGIHKTSWFIWDYAKIENKGIYGAILICNEQEKQDEYGRLLALKKLKSRKKAIGAFIPVYKDYGDAVYLPPLDRSDSFKRWAESLTIKSQENLDRWLIESLPQNHKLGNYSAFCHLDRNSSHIAIVLVKSIKKNPLPKWLVTIDIIFILMLLVILYLGLCFDYWLQLNLRVRFVLSYALASVVPLSLLFVTAYGYLSEYEKTSEELESNELQLSLKAFDSYKLTIIREYKIAFNKIINDPELIKLIEEKGVDNKLVTDYVVNKMENKASKDSLPILGTAIYDETGKGAFTRGSIKTNIDVNKFFDSFESMIIDVLRGEMERETPGIKLKEYKIDKDKDLAKNAYNALTGRELKKDLYKFLGIPLPRKKGDFCGYQLINTIKTRNKTKYILQIIWEDKALDEKIIQKNINSIALSKSKQGFIAYKIDGQKIRSIGETRHASKKLKDKMTEYAKQSSYLNKTDKYIFEDNIIVVMPALNYNQIIFVGWINRIEIIYDLFIRKLTSFIILFLTSLFMLRICSLRSSSVFLKPITMMKKALDEVSLGNLNIGFKDYPNNELGKLSIEFDKMIEGLREKERLSKLISDQAVEALKKNSSGLLSDTETFNGVALVSDIRNFTGMSEKYDPVIITELLNEHFAEMAKIISDNGGLIYKFIGDAIEAVFPEKEELNKSAIERAFQAGCQMIIKLKAINERRTIIKSFTYRIGVGLCYGTMYSGSVGSLETRLDYSILGDPLKNAAKLEALTIQNPNFPFVVDEKIAEKMADLGLGFKKINSNNLDFNIYTIDDTSKITNSDFLLSSDKDNFVNKDEEKKEEINYFSFTSNTSFFKNKKDVIFYSFLVLYISLLITFGINLLYNTIFNNLKSESDKYAARLIEQLKCDDILKSCFDTLCLEFYDDLKKIDIYKNPQNLNHEIEKIALKYEKLGVPLPRYCCCFLDENKIPEDQRIIYKGFSREICNSMHNYSKEYIKYIEKYKNYSFSEMTREQHIDLGDEVLNPFLRKFLTDGSRFYNLQQSILFRRSSLENIGGEEMFFNTDRIYDESQDNLISYIFCGMPQNINEDKLINYYTLLAGKEMLLALKNNKGWYFSPDFPESEKELLKKDINNTNINKKGYYYKKIDINGDPFTVYTISRDLFSNYYPSNYLTIFTFFSSFIILTIIFWFIETNSLFIKNSIATILRKDIFLSAIVPILTVCFVSYLYVEEESNIKRSELLLNLNQQINEIENREYYYSPLCKQFLKSLPYTKYIHESLIKIINSKDEERNIQCNNLNDYLKKNLVGRKYKKVYFASDSIDPYFDIKEIIILGKEGWVASAHENEKDKNNISIFGDLISKLVKNTFFNKDKSSLGKNDNEALKEELISEKTLSVLSSAYGNNMGIQLINLPENLLIVVNAYSSIALFIGCFPDIDNPDYILVSLIYFENELKPYICNKRNDKNISYKAHLASDSMDDKIFCFYSPNLHVGEFFFHDNWYINHREELKTVKELCLASAWINTSYLPLSKKVDINGIHYLEARQGYHVKDNVYATLGSEHPIKENMNNKLQYFGIIIIFSLIMIFFIAQSIITDFLNPVRKLMKGAIEASKGNYKYRTNFMRKDELGTLCLSFDKMMKSLEEKLLMNRMVSKTALKVASDLSEIQSKRVKVVLLYITVPDFNKIMQNTPSNELFSKLRKQIASISKIVIDNGGDIDKIMGEKMLIAFRVKDKTPEEVAYDASQVANLISKCDELYFDVSIGVNYGEVISGYLGVGAKRDFTIIGDPVNVAARIAIFAEKLESDRLIISKEIMKLVNNIIKTEEYGEVLFKGKTKPAKVYKII